MNMELLKAFGCNMDKITKATYISMYVPDDEDVFNITYKILNFEKMYTLYRVNGEVTHSYEEYSDTYTYSRKRQIKLEVREGCDDMPSLATLSRYFHKCPEKNLFLDICPYFDKELTKKPMFNLLQSLGSRYSYNGYYMNIYSANPTKIIEELKEQPVIYGDYVIQLIAAATLYGYKYRIDYSTEKQ